MLKIINYIGIYLFLIKYVKMENDKTSDPRFAHTEKGYVMSLSVLVLLIISLTSYISKKYKIKILPDATLCLLYGSIITN